MTTDVPEKDEDDTADDNSSWENRILCSDGNCIGVVGPDGHCKECGLKYEGELPEAGESEINEAPAADANEDADEDADADEGEDEVDAASATTEIPDDADAATADDDWDSRALCSDGNCIGVIGPDGKCKECGKPGK